MATIVNNFFITVCDLKVIIWLSRPSSRQIPSRFLTCKGCCCAANRQNGDEHPVGDSYYNFIIPFSL
jgi:hypothetical protein